MDTSQLIRDIALGNQTDGSCAVSQMTREFFNSADSLLRSRGWEMIANSVRAAMFVRTYRRGERELIFTGWASGSRVRVPDLVHSLHDTEPEGRDLAIHGYAREIARLDIIGGKISSIARLYDRVNEYLSAHC